MAERIDTKCADELDAKLQAKEPRLSKSIRTYIRRLKESGKWDEAVRLREAMVTRRNTRQKLVADELHKTLAEVICTEDPVKEAAGEIKIIWLMNAANIIPTSQERNTEIIEILESRPPELQPQIEALMPRIRDEVEPLLPTAG